MSEPTRKEVLVFNEALELSSPARREAYLARACAGDEPLRRRVEALLRAHAEAECFFETVPGGERPASPRAAGADPAVRAGAPPVQKAGDRIGRYKLLQQIGEGGCGVVYMAEQEEPVRRRVALKVIKLGMDTGSVIARFEAERQALALMDHPNIARVLDAGATETGRPYFVMELVRGIKLTDYCDQNRLSMAERLRLFMQVCHAVQHAHQKGIIHRDLKPSNILVTMHDGVPVPKVIDFGIAKATTGHPLTDKTLFTAFEQFVGTPAYMSPEQAEMSALDIDTRTDVYSLGVLLYELLTGKTPFDATELLKAGLDAMRQAIREKEPPRPSTRLSTLPMAGAEELARSRRERIPRLVSLIRGDLDWIVMKCLEKDRTRRYETANGLAQDIERHLKSEPVMARPPSLGYRARKFVRRHRAGVGVGAALVATVLLGTAASLWQAVRANRQAALAEARRQEADASHQAALDAQRRAERSQKEVSHQLARQYVQNGVRKLNDGFLLSALVWFTEALRLDEGDPVAEEVHRLRIGAIVKQSPPIPQLLFRKGKGGVTSVEFSPDGRKLLAAGWPQNPKIWDIASGNALELPLEHAQNIIHAAFSPDGQRVATASCDHTARIWSANSWAPLSRPMKHGDAVRSAIFSPDGLRVATASDDYAARVWSAEKGDALTPPLCHKGPVCHVAFSPDGRFIVTASEDSTARVWDAVIGTPVTPTLQHTGTVWWATFSPDGRLVATASEDLTARIWDARTGAPVTPSLPHSREVNSVTFSPEGRRLLTACGEAPIRTWLRHEPCEAQLWDVATGKALTPPMKHKDGIFYAVFSPDGHRVATASRDDTARVWDAATGDLITPPLEHFERVFRVAFSPDGRRLATAGGFHDGMIRIWDLRVTDEGRRNRAYLKEAHRVSPLTFSANGQFVAGKYNINSLTNRSARVWSAITGEPVTPLPPCETNLIHHMTFSPDGRLVGEAADDGGRLVDARTGAIATPILRHSGNVLWIAFSPDSRRVVTASEDKTARVWDARTGEALSPPMSHESNVVCAAFRPDGHQVVTASEDKTARIWDVSTGAAVTPPLPHSHGVRLATFSPDGGRVLTATTDGETRIWDARTGLPVTPPMKQTGEEWKFAGIESIAFSPDGHRIVVADSSDWSARIWDADTGTPVTPPLEHGGPVWFAAFSHNGRYVVTASSDATARVWDATTGQPITPPLEHEGLVNEARFFSDDSGLRTVGWVILENYRRFVATWSLTPDNRPAKDLVRLAHLLSLHRLDASGTLVPLDLEGMTNTSWTLQP